ncbi:DNA topoisomerase IB [Rhodanobacter hydrolyticus]
MPLLRPKASHCHAPSLFIEMADVEKRVHKRLERTRKVAGPLVYSSDAQAGYRRARKGKGTIYYDTRGRRVTRADVLERIRLLAIPPAYTDVWICADPRGHLQATGRDARGRKQYRYHADWRRHRDADKFDHMREFGAILPSLRRRVRADLALPGWPKSKVLALVVRLLDETLVRVGNEEYAHDNGSYGLTTLRTRHLKREHGCLWLRFRAKSGRHIELMLPDNRLVRLLRRVQQLPGQRLFQYLDAEGGRHAVDSGMVNAYLQQASVGNFTAKDFRTWSGTVRAAGLLTQTPVRARERSNQAALNAVMTKVATLLRNTPSVCRASYVHPYVLRGWKEGTLQHFVPAEIVNFPRKLEAGVLRFLHHMARS